MDDPVWLSLLIVASVCALVSAGVRGYLHTLAVMSDGDESASDYGRSLLAGAAVAVVAGAIAGWRLDGVDVWLGGVAGLVGACTPWLDAMVRGMIRRWSREVGPPGGGA